MKRLLVVVTACTLTYALLFLTFHSVFLGNAVYEDVQPESNNQEVLSYLRGGSASLAFLTENEQEHMKDVRFLLILSNVLAGLAVGILLGVVWVLYKGIRHLAEELAGRALRAAGWTLLGLTGFVGVAAILNFEVFWILFHVLLFPQGNWVFPAESMLIQLYPAAFFQRFGIMFGIRIVCVGICAVLLGHWLVQMKRHEEFFEKKAKKK